MALLDVHDLRVGLNTSRGPADALRGVSFSIDRGDTVGLIGESGCGKSMTALALMGLLPPGARVSGSIRFYSQEHPRPVAAPGVRGETSLLPPPLGEGWGRGHA